MRNNDNRNFNRNNRRDGKPYIKKKVEQKTYQKRFDSYEGMVNELLNMPGFLSDELNACFDNYNSYCTLQEFNKFLADLFADNCPDVLQGENMFWALNMSPDRCFLKTGMYVAFGYSFNKEKDENGDTIITSVDATYIIYNETRAKTFLVVEYLDDASGWELVPNKKPNNRNNRHDNEDRA